MKTDDWPQRMRVRFVKDGAPSFTKITRMRRGDHTGVWGMQARVNKALR